MSVHHSIQYSFILHLCISLIKQSILIHLCISSAYCIYNKYAFFIELLSNMFCVCTTISLLICEVNLSIQFVKHGYVAHLFYTVNISCLNILQ